MAAAIRLNRKSQVFWVRPGEYRRRRHELIAIATAVVVLLVSFGCVRAQEPATPTPSWVTLPRIEANRYLAPAGELAGGVLPLRLGIPTASGIRKRTADRPSARKRLGISDGRVRSPARLSTSP